MFCGLWNSGYSRGDSSPFVRAPSLRVRIPDTRPRTTCLACPMRRWILPRRGCDAGFVRQDWSFSSSVDLAHARATRCIIAFKRASLRMQFRYNGLTIALRGVVDELGYKKHVRHVQRRLVISPLLRITICHEQQRARGRGRRRVS